MTIKPTLNDLRRAFYIRETGSTGHFQDLYFKYLKQRLGII